MAERFVAACAAMKADRWWDGPETTDKAIRRAVLKEAARVRLGLAPRA